MTETTARPQEMEGHKYSSPAGINYNSIPWKLWEKSKDLFWDPKNIDFSKDAEDWKSLSSDQQLAIGGSARGFMVGEEAVTVDILPLLRVMSDEGRLEDTMYLTMFAMEEAKHVDFFRRWFDAVGFDASMGGGGGDGYGNGAGPDPFGALGRIMRRLDNDRSPKRILDATLLYNHLIEAVAAISGYRRWNETFTSIGQDKLPGIQEGLRYVQRDERRHIAYGTYLARRVIAENPELWEWVEQRWERMAGPMMQGDSYQAQLARRRLEVLAVARNMRPEEVEGTAVEDFEPADA